MKSVLLSISFTLVVLSSFAQTTVKKPATQTNTAAPASGYNIAFTLTPYKNCWVYLGTYFGKNYILVDSSFVNGQSSGAFKGKSKLTPGLYFFVSPKRSKLFDIMVDVPQHFTVMGDSASAEPASITGSAENDLFMDYTRFISTIGPKMSDLDVQLKDPNLTKEKGDNIRAQRLVYAKQQRDYQENLMAKHPNSVMATFFNLLKTPDVPKTLPLLPNGQRDSAYIGRYYKEHYWDNVAFNDDRILHNKFFDEKLETYYKYYVSPDADSVWAEVNYMLLYARTGKEIFHYLLGRFTDKYINPEIMGQDKVFIYLYENYFAKGDTLWLNSAQRKYITDRYYNMVSVVLGKPAASLDLVDTAGKPISMYDIKAPFTFVLFWDPTCSHCKEEVPRVDSIYRAKWKAEGVKVFAVNINAATVGEWKTFINEHHLTTWEHGYQTKEDMDADAKAQRPNYRQLYDVSQTPTMYLLDDKKRIIAKKLSLLQFDGLIDYKLKNPNPAK